MHSLSAEAVTRSVSTASRLEPQEALSGVWSRITRSQRSALVLGTELGIAAFSYTLALLVFAQGQGMPWGWSVLRETLAPVIALRLAVLLKCKLYKRSVRYSTILDVGSVTRAVLAGSVLIAMLLIWRLSLAPLAIFLCVVDGAFLEVLWCGLHLTASLQKTRDFTMSQQRRRALIVGAGDAGMTLLREIAMDGANPFRPVGVLDDDQSKWGRTICGVPVLGGTARLSEIASELGVDDVLVCIPSATRSQMRAILDSCRAACVPVHMLPPLQELLTSHRKTDKTSLIISGHDLRSPRIEDLLQRDEIALDPEQTRRLVSDQVVLVTGAGGSIGSELCRQLASAGPRKLLLLDKSENGLFFANLEAVELLGSEKVRSFLADLVDRDRVRGLMKAEQPDIIFHAAAYKHVAMLEAHPKEAIRNNVIGTRNIAEAAVEFGAKRFVNISTDKAVNPCNYMGFSKKLTELCVQELSSLGRTKFSSVRFGNVAGSSGSVLPLFWERIERDKSVRVTDARATRFFMSIREAVHLIFRAAAIGRGGETFVLEMGEPVSIYDLAKTMMLLAGKQPDRDLKIEFTGLKPGEKLSEELWEERERPVPSESSHILVIGEANPLSRGILSKIGKLEHLLAANDEAALLEYVAAMFPDFYCSRGEIMPLELRAAECAAKSVGAA